MLIVQKYHSIHEIDSEFISTLETLLQNEVPNFNFLVERHDSAPQDEVFTYFLFFGPTQNTPIGFAQLSLKSIPSENIIPWHRKMKFWNKDYLHWKQLSWKITDGASGLFVFDSKFARSGKEKIQSLINEYEARDDIMSAQYFFYKGLQDYQPQWSVNSVYSKDHLVLEPFMKAQKSYQDYLESLTPETSNAIKQNWKQLHRESLVELGDYPSPLETPQHFPVSEDQLKRWHAWGAQILTFEKNLKVLGCLLVIKGKNGNIFFEPIPFEPQDRAIVDDVLYIQYALLKFFEMPEGRKCHLLKNASKLRFEDKKDSEFFNKQGFQAVTITENFSSKIPEINGPL